MFVGPGQPSSPQWQAYNAAWSRSFPSPVGSELSPPARSKFTAPPARVIGGKTSPVVAGRLDRWVRLCAARVKPRPHRQQCRSNVRLCRSHIRLCCPKRQQRRTEFVVKFQVERCFDIVAVFCNNVEQNFVFRQN